MMPRKYRSKLLRAQERADAVDEAVELDRDSEWGDPVLYEDFTLSELALEIRNTAELLGADGSEQAWRTHYDPDYETDILRELEILQGLFDLLVAMAAPLKGRVRVRQ
jgi:hypothetical protein